MFSEYPILASYVLGPPCSWQVATCASSQVASGGWALGLGYQGVLSDVC